MPIRSNLSGVRNQAIKLVVAKVLGVNKIAVCEPVEFVPKERGDYGGAMDYSTGMLTTAE